MITINQIRQAKDYSQLKSLINSGKKVVIQKVDNEIKLIQAFNSKGDCWRFIKNNRLKNSGIFHQI